MRNTLKNRSAAALLIGAASFSCGKIVKEETTSYRGKANESLRASSSNLELSPQLLLKGSLEAGVSTSQRLHQLTSHLGMEFEHLAALGLSGQEKLTFKMLLRDAKQQPVWEEEQESEIGAPDLLWQPKINGEEGNYHLELTVWVKTEAGKRPLASHSASFDLDTSLPLMTIEALLSPITDGGLRNLNVKARVFNEHDVQCASAHLLHPSLAEPILVKLLPSYQEGEILLEGKAEGLSAALASGNVLVKIKCQDAAGNVTDLAQAAGLAGERAISLGIDLQAKRGQELGAPAGSALRAFMSRPELELKLNLLDPKTGLPHSDALIEAEKTTLRVYLTETPVEGVDELLKNKTVLWNQLYAPQLKIALPASYQGARTLYLSLVRLEISQNRSSLLTRTPLALYFDNAGASLTWASGPSFARAEKDRLLSVAAESRVEGAPLAAPLQAEYTLDGSSWQPLNVTVKSSSETTSELQFAYPLNAETAFRVRLKALDLAGNVSYSPLSAQLVARSGFPSLEVAPSERAACLSSGNPGAHLRPLLSSSFICRKADALGQLVGPAHASLVLQNRGQLAPEFYSTAQIPAAMGYKIFGDGQLLTQGRIAPPDLFRLAAGDLRLLQFTLNPSWLSAKRLELVLDAEESDANSTTNSCYPDSSPFPTVVLQDIDQGLSLKMSPFACDPEGLLKL